MQNAIWWFGAIHAFAYCLVGLAFVIVWLTWKVHSRFGMMKRILQWHYARARWQERGKSGLTDAEWARGEPKP